MSTVINIQPTVTGSIYTYEKLSGKKTWPRGHKTFFMLDEHGF